MVTEEALLIPAVVAGVVPALPESLPDRAAGEVMVLSSFTNIPERRTS